MDTPSNSAKSLRIFISSPGDVADERERAKQVVQSLRRRYAGFFMLKPILWEELPLQPDMSFQQGIDLVLSQQGVDIAVFILWSRLGSPTGPLVVKDDGTAYRSGTEREYDLMMRARAQSKETNGHARPDILIYTRRDESSFDERLRGQRTEEKEELIAQKKRVESFISEEFKDAESGTNTSAYHSFDRPVTFSQRLRAHLMELLDERAGGEFTEVVWDIEKQGPPFLGLSAFQPEHADVFFGREDEILEARNALLTQARNGCAFLLLSGASGSGKSSLARAGLLPAILENELDDTVTAWRSVVATPRELGADPLAGLVEKLAADDILPELRSGTDGLASLIKGLGKDPEATIDLRVRDAFAAAGKRVKGGLRVLLVLDQLEEIFAGAAAAKDRRETFFSALETLTRSGLVWTVATVRSDFMDRVQAEPVLVRMMEGGGLRPVLPPEAAALRHMIEGPARLAGLSFEEKDGKKLSDRILDDATGKGELLPLLGFVLEKLFAQRTGQGVLRWKTYKDLGGVDGSLATRADEVFKGLPELSQTSLGRVLKALVTEGREALGGARDEVDQGRLVRRPARRADLEKIPGAAALLEAFVKERLFTASGDAGGDANVTLAHESLLRVWGRAIDWATQNREFLQTRARVAARMRERSRLLEGDPLLEAAVFQLRRNGGDFSPEEQSFIEKCREQVEIAQRKREQRRRTVSAVLAVLTLVSLLTAGWAVWSAHKLRDAKAGLADQLVKTQRSLERSQLEEGRAWLERANLAWKAEKFPLKALLFAGRAVGFMGYGSLDTDPPELKRKYAPLLGKPFTDPGAEQERLQEVKAVTEFVNSVPRAGLPIWSSPLQAHHRDTVTSVAFSPDGSRLASGAWDNTVKLWDAASGRELATLKGHSRYVTSVAFSPDGSRLASGSRDSTVKLWDVVSGEELTTFQGHSNLVSSVAFSPDGTRLASGAEDNTVKLWDAASGRELATLKGHSNEVTSVAFSPDGTCLASGSRDTSVKLWDVVSGQERATLQGHSNLVSSVAFSRDGTRLASGSRDTSVKLWDAASGQELATLERHSEVVSSLAFSPDGSRLASGAWDNTVKIWDAASGRELATLKGHSRPVTSVAFSPDSARLASGSDDDTVKLWDATSGQELASIEGHSDEVTSVAFSPDGARLTSGSEDKTVKLWDAANGQELATLKGHSRPVTSVAFSPDGTRLASGSGDHTVKLWDAVSGQELATLERHSEDVTCVAFSPDGTRLATGSDDDTVKLWDTASGQELATLKGHEAVVTNVAFSPDGARLASGSDDDTVKLWDAASGQELATLERHSEDVTSVAFSPDGTRLASGARDNTLKLWDAASGQELATLEGHSEEVTSVAFSPDGTRLASGSYDKTVKLWDAASGQELANLEGHSERVTSVAFSPDGTRLAFGSKDNTVKIWDLASGQELSTLYGHSWIVTSAAFSPDGTRLASGSWDETVKLWDAASGQELATLKGHSKTVNSVAFSPDGTRLASGFGDGTVKLWDAANGQELATLKGHSSPVFNVTFSPDGTRLASRSGDETVKLWDAASGQEIAEKPSFAFDPLSVSADGKIRAVMKGNFIRLLPSDAAPDLLALERKGYLELIGRDITWKTNPSLLSTRVFAPVHWRPNLLTKLAAAGSHEQAFLLRLQLCGQGGQWRALPGCGRQPEKRG